MAIPSERSTLSTVDEQRGTALTEALGATPAPAARATTRKKASKRLAAAERREAPQLIPTDVVPLSWGQRLSIVDALVHIIDGLYVHLPLKRAQYGFDPIRALAQLRQQIPNLNDLQFHRALTGLMNRLRDAHTQYSGPLTIAGAVARLPFLVEMWGPPDARQFVVSKVSDRRLVDDSNFVAGVRLQWWNGVPFDRAVDLHADSETGGRPDARYARALDSLTFRSLEYSPPPDEHWVDVGYFDKAGKARIVRFQWRVVFPNRAPTASRRRGARLKRGIDPASEAIRRAKKLMFSSRMWTEERVSNRARRSLIERYQDFLSSRTVRTQSGSYGYLRIWSFDVDDDDEFLDAVIAHLRKLPNRGMIVDIRDNPGGFIWAAERMLQLFTPRDVTPTKFALRATPMTAQLAAARFNQEEFGPWADSLAQAAATGEPYSVHLPITTIEQCNDRWQHYSGPVVVVVDANTYSSGDLFAAGIVDNQIGPLVCIGEATGAGGANVWTSGDVADALRAADLELPELANGANFNVAVRRAVRSGDADGVLIEDVGIPGQPYFMTADDIFRSNCDLIEHCGELLAAQPRSAMDVKRVKNTLAITTNGLEQVDVYADGHPVGPTIAVRAKQRKRVALPANSEEVEIIGFADNTVRQRRRLRQEG